VSGANVGAAGSATVNRRQWLDVPAGSNRAREGISHGPPSAFLPGTNQSADTSEWVEEDGAACSSLDLVSTTVQGLIHRAGPWDCAAT
jgi:hypothetical protein